MPGDVLFFRSSPLFGANAHNCNELKCFSVKEIVSNKSTENLRRTLGKRQKERESYIRTHHSFEREKEPKRSHITHNRVYSFVRHGQAFALLFYRRCFFIFFFPLLCLFTLPSFHAFGQPSIIFSPLDFFGTILLHYRRY